MEKRTSKPRRANKAGPIGHRAADNLKQLRQARRLTQDELAEANERLGRPMTMQIIGKTETGDRRIDVDDLVTFAIALGVTPNRLLLPDSANADRPAELTPGYQVSELDAWKWATGEHPLPKGYDAPQLQMVLDSDREARFTRENRPHRPPDAPLGAALQAHPDLVEMIVKVAREAWHLGIDIRQVQYGLDSAHWMAAAEGNR